MTLFRLAMDSLALAIFGGGAYLAWTALPFPPLPWFFAVPATVIAIMLHGAAEYLESPGSPKRFGEP